MKTPSRSALYLQEYCGSLSESILQCVVTPTVASQFIVYPKNSLGFPLESVHAVPPYGFFPYIAGFAVDPDHIPSLLLSHAWICLGYISVIVDKMPDCVTFCRWSAVDGSASNVSAPDYALSIFCTELDDSFASFRHVEDVLHAYCIGVGIRSHISAYHVAG